jgi:hypothetical protein
MEKELIAPCGMNCNVCSAYLAYSHDLPKRKGNVKCKGCRPRNKQCAFVKKRCGDRLMKNEVQYCFVCEKFPCEHIEKINSKYVKRWNVSFIENLEYIRDHGEKKFLAKERRKWKCGECGGTVCIHNKKCYDHEHIETWKE